MKNNCIDQDDILFFGRKRKRDRDLLLTWLSFLLALIVMGMLLVLLAVGLGQWRLVDMGDGLMVWVQTGGSC